MHWNYTFCTYPNSNCAYSFSWENKLIFEPTFSAIYTLSFKSRRFLSFDYYLTSTEIFSNTQIRISIPVHFAFFNVIIGKRKPPKEQSLGGFGAPDWIRTSVLACRLGRSWTVPAGDQDPTEWSLSGRQGRNPDFMRVWGTSHKISTHLQKPWEPLVRLGSHGFPGFGRIVVKQ